MPEVYMSRGRLLFEVGRIIFLRPRTVEFPCAPRAVFTAPSCCGVSRVAARNNLVFRPFFLPRFFSSRFSLFSVQSGASRENSMLHLAK